MQKKLDPELLAYFYDIKDKITTEHQDYIKGHPEIRQILVDFLTKILMNKPEDIYSFTTEYFSFFEKNSTRDQLVPLVIVGPKYCGKKSMITALIRKYPQYFERAAFYTTRPLTKEPQNEITSIVLSSAEFLEKKVQGDFLLFDFDGEFYDNAICKKLLENIVNKGKICLIPMDMKTARLHLNDLTKTNLLLIIPKSLESIKERLINKRKVNFDQIDEAMNTIKSEIEFGGDTDIYLKKLVNDGSDTFKETFEHEVKSVYEFLKF